MHRWGQGRFDGGAAWPPLILLSDRFPCWVKGITFLQFSTSIRLPMNHGRDEGELLILAGDEVGTNLAIGSEWWGIFKGSVKEAASKCAGWT